MSNFTNNPQGNISTERKIYVHQPLTFDHFGVHVRIHENGKVTITCVSEEKDEDGKTVFDEVEVSASLIFKIAQQLKITRSESFASFDKKV